MPKSEEKRTKVTFYAAPDVKAWLDTLSSGDKSKLINECLRDGRDKQIANADRLRLIEERLVKLERDARFDGFAIAALRKILLNRFGPTTRDEFKKEYDDLYFGSRTPQRNPE